MALSTTKLSTDEPKTDPNIATARLFAMLEEIKRAAEDAHEDAHEARRAAEEFKTLTQKEVQGFNIAVFIRNLFAYGVTEIERYYPKQKK